MITNIAVNEGQSTQFLCQTEGGVLESRAESVIRLYRQVTGPGGVNLSDDGITFTGNLMTTHYFDVNDVHADELFVCILSDVFNFQSVETNAQLFRESSWNLESYRYQGKGEGVLGVQTPPLSGKRVIGCSNTLPAPPPPPGSGKGPFCACLLVREVGDVRGYTPTSCLENLPSKSPTPFAQRHFQSWRGITAWMQG